MSDNYNNDHDLLIELKTKLDSVIDSINDLKDGTTSKIADHEARIRSVELSVTRIMTWGSAAMVVLGVVEYALQYIIK